MTYKLSIRQFAVFGLLVLFFLNTMALFLVSFSIEKIAAPGPLTKPQFVILKKGEGVSSISHHLFNETIIDSPWLFSIIVRLWGKKLKAGEYKFLPHMSLSQVVTLLNQGKLVTHRVTIPEGLTSAQIVVLLRNNTLLEGVIPNIPPEGSLFPTTFRVHRGHNRLSLLTQMTRLMEQAREKLDATIAPSCPLTSKERLILASIIEKETNRLEERAHISGVFYNRLKRKMPLQADPCVIYALTEGKQPLNRSLTKKDLKIISPFNTYLNQGLPPRPICNPGIASLKAAYHPLATANLYFVAKPDGSHEFSKDYTLHAKHHQNLRKHRRAQTSAPL